MKKFLILSLVLTACYSSSPDKTIGGAILGAGWGAGAGAVVGNQLDGSPSGEGAAVGAGFGLIDGALTGAGIDVAEDQLEKQNQELSTLQTQNAANSREIGNLQDSLDYAPNTSLSGVYQVFFDTDVTSLRSGSTANLEVLAEAMKKDSGIRSVNVVGHSDDSGDPDYNKRLAEARARSVSSYLTARGIANDSIIISSHGSKRPVANNSTDAGKQLNRRVDIFVTR